jgi:hypothetical protein
MNVLQYDEPVHRQFHRNPESLHTMKTGDAIATVAKPIARTIDYFFGTDIAGCTGCKQMQHNLNAGMSFAGAMYDRFWHSKNNQHEKTQMQFIITKQIAVEAETPEEAFSKIAEGTTISLSVNVRPQPQQAPRPVTLQGTPAPR